jgi:hypothetical protein
MSLPVNDAAEFRADIDYLYGLSRFMLETLDMTGHLFYMCGPTIEQQLLESLSPTALRAVLAPWPTNREGAEMISTVFAAVQDNAA